MEFWNDISTDKSWNVLIDLAKKYDFIVIGGWAAYLHTKTLKSKDIDIVVNFDTLEKIGMEHQLKKNSNLKKYEIVISEISVDIYVPFFSNLIIPVSSLEEYYISMEGIKVVAPEVLLILKQQAESERKDSVKGQKDRIDIVSLLINSNIDLKKYSEFVKKYNLKNYPIKLREIIRNARAEFHYLGVDNLRKVKLLKRDLLDKLKIK